MLSFDECSVDGAEHNIHAYFYSPSKRDFHKLDEIANIGITCFTT